MVGVPSAGIIYRIIVEEEALIAAFGDEYLDYRRHTRRPMPFVI